MHLLRTVFLSGILVVGALRPASGQVIVSTSATAPADNLLLSFNTSTTAGIGWRADSASSVTSENWRDVGQLFTSSQTALLDKITVVTSSGVNSPARGVGFTLTLYSLGSGFSTANAQVLQTLAGTTPSGSISSGTFLSFDLPDLQLTAGITYGFLLHFDAMTDGRSIPLRINSSSNAFADGRLLTRVNSADGTPGSLATSTSSLEFYVQTAAIPEPASAAFSLGAIALAALAWRRRIACARN